MSTPDSLAVVGPANGDWRHFPCTQDDPTSWIEGRFGCLAIDVPDSVSAGMETSRSKRRRASLYSLFATGDLDKNGDSLDLGRPAAAVDVKAAGLLKRRVHNLLGLTPDKPLDSPPDCQVLRYRPGQRVQAHGDAADGLPLLIVLQGVAVIKVGGVVVERVGPGGCVGGGQFVLQVNCGGSLHCWPLRLPTIISQQKNRVDVGA